MSIGHLTIDELTNERDTLQSDYETMVAQIRKFELDLHQMKANLNAIDGALQLAKKLVARAQGNSNSLEIKEKK